MKIKTLTKAVLISSVLGAGAFAASSASAAGLTPGNYLASSIQNICLLADHTWYGEDFAGWTGVWRKGPTKEDKNILYGNYHNGGGNDAMVVAKGNVDWTEWRDHESFHTFLDGTFVRTGDTCTPPPAVASARQNPMD